MPADLGRIWQLHPVVYICVPIFAAIAIQMVFRRQSEWEDVFLRAAGELLQGLDIYRSGRAFLYPPFSAFAAIPFTMIPPLLGRLVWASINIVALIVMFRSAWLISGNGPVPVPSKENFKTSAAIVLAVVASFPFALNSLAHQQVDVIIDALILLGCYWTMTGPGRAGAVLIGLAAAVKGPPLLFVAYFVVRRRFDLAAIVLAVACAVNLLPDLIAHAPDSGLWVLTWVNRYVIPTQGWDAKLGIWGTAPVFNQSLAGTFGRIGENLNPHAVKAAAYLLLLAMGVTSLAVAARAKSANPGPSALPSQTAAEIGQIAALMLLASPNSSPAHFGILVVAAFVVARSARGSGSPLLWGILSIAGLLGALSNKDLAGTTIYDLLLNAGIITWLSVLLWSGCVLAIASRLVSAPAKTLTKWLIPARATAASNG